jgi:hypothetical protein
VPRINKADQMVVEETMRLAEFDLAPNSARARELGRQVWMRRVSPGCVLMISTHDGRAFGNPLRPYWLVFGIGGDGANLSAKDLTLRRAVEAAMRLESAELKRLGKASNGGKQT